MALAAVFLAACAGEEAAEPTVVPTAVATAAATVTAVFEPTPTSPAIPSQTPTHQPEPTAIQPAIAIMDQPLASDGRLTVSHVTVAEQAWLVIHAQRDGQVGEVLGYAALAPGDNEDILVTVDPFQSTPELVAIIHRDEEELGKFEFPGADAPLLLDSTTVSAGFTIEPQFATPTIVVSDQEVTQDGLVQVQQATMTEPGWLLIHADESGAIGKMLGFAWLEEGLSENVTVPIMWRDGTPRLYAVLYRDAGRPNRLDQDADMPLLIGGEPVVTPFTVSLPPNVLVLDQPVVDGEVVIERVVVDDPSWLVIYFDDDGSFGRIIGFVPLAAGVNEKLVVPVVEDAVTPLLHILLHEDTVVGDEFDFPAVDRPLTYDGRLPAPFTFRTNSGNYIITRDQSLTEHGGTEATAIVVPLVVVDAPTWLVIRVDADGVAGDIVGMSWLPAGISRDVSVVVDTENVTATLYAALHLDGGTPEQFDFPDGPDIPLQHSRNDIQSPFALSP
jgi:hypothetical protein